MKKLVISFLLIVISLVGISQNLLKNKLLEVFSVEQTKLILEDDQQKKYYSNMVFNSFSIEGITFNKLKNQNVVILNSIDLKNIDGTISTVTPKKIIESVKNGTFNILRVRIDRDFNDSKVYLLGNTNHTLTITSFKTLSKLQQQ